MKNKIVISGYYGFKNLGDEAILAGIIHSLRKVNKNLDITVLSRNPCFTEKNFAVKAVQRNNYKKILKVISGNDLFISGGGSLLQNITGWKSIPYYLGLTLAAQIMGKKTAFYAQGIGPIKGFKWRKILKWVANKTDVITVRDENSFNLLKKSGVKIENMKITTDPVFSLQNKNFKLSSEFQFLSKYDNIIGVSVRPWANNDYLSILAEEVNSFAEKINAFILIIPFHFLEDFETSKRFKSELTVPAKVLSSYYDPEQILSIYKKINILVGVRLHSIIFAVLQYIPFIPISYDPKVDSFLHSFNLIKPLAINNFDNTKFRKKLKQIWNNRDVFYNKDIKMKIKNNKNISLQNAEMIVQLLEE